MRFKNLLGLLAIGGAVAYAQKKRGGDMSLAGIKNSLRGVIDNVKNQVQSVVGNQSGATQSRGTDIGQSSTSSLGSSDYASGTSSYSSGYSNGNDIGRKY